MGKVFQFVGRARTGLGVKPRHPRRGGKTAKSPYVYLKIYIDPEPEKRLRVVKRNVLHGILSTWGWMLTKGLFGEIFEHGGAFKIRCRVSEAGEIREQIALRLPDLTVRRVRAA